MNRYDDLHEVELPLMHDDIGVPLHHFHCCILGLLCLNCIISIYRFLQHNILL